MRKSYLLAIVAVLFCGNAFAVDWSSHPHLKRAHELLEEAKKEMAQANDKKKSEFGGHRAEAMKHVNQAQGELERSVEFANNPANK